MKKLLPFLLCLATTSSSWASVRLVQIAIGSVVSASSSTVTFSSPTQAGDTILIVGRNNNATPSVQSINDNQGDSYGLLIATGVNVSGQSANVNLYISSVSFAGVTSSTIVWSGSVGNSQAIMAEVSGLTATPFDVSGSSITNTIAANGVTATASATTSVPNEYVIGIGGCGSTQNLWTAAPGYILREGSPSTRVYYEDKTVSITATYTAPITFGVTQALLGMIATFKIAPTVVTENHTILSNGKVTIGNAKTIFQ